MPFDCSELMQKHGFIPANHEQPNWFPVSIDHVYDAQGRRVPNYKRVQREDTGDTLAVHSDKYALITYQRQFEAFDQALAASSLERTDMAVHTDLTHNGARCFRQYVLPAYTIAMPNGRDLAMRFIMFGSYDGSSSFHGRCGGFDFVCANTSVFGTVVAEKRVRHSGKDADIAERIEQAIAYLVDAAESYIANAARLARWPRIDVDAQLARQLFDKLPQATKVLGDHLIARFVEQDQYNLWGAWNVLTTWSSHPATASNRASVSADREKRVTSLVEGRDWQAVEREYAAAA